MNTETSPVIAGHPPHVLLVDDDPDIRAVLQDYLAKNDMRVTALASGYAGIFAARLLLGIAEAPGMIGNQKATG